MAELAVCQICSQFRKHCRRCLSNNVGILYSHHDRCQEFSDTAQHSSSGVSCLSDAGAFFYVTDGADRCSPTSEHSDVKERGTSITGVHSCTSPS